MKEHAKPCFNQMASRPCAMLWHDWCLGVLTQVWYRQLVFCYSFRYTIYVYYFFLLGRETNLDSFKAWIDEISASLGVLINIVEAEPTALDKIKAITLQRGDSSTVSSTILEIVAKLFNLCSKEENDPITSTNDNEVTLESLRDSEGQAMGSIIGAYSGILLGFLVVNDPEACAQAKCMLSSDSLRPLIGVIQRCFAFYKNVGALTPKTEASLQGLLVQLESQI